MAGKTMAEHAREYRTRKAERIARMEAALERIAEHPGELANDACWHRVEIARAALAKPAKEA